MSGTNSNLTRPLRPPPQVTITSQSSISGPTLASPPAMPPTQLTMSLCSRQRDALKRLLHDQGIDDQLHHDLDLLLHILLARMQQEGWSIDTRGQLMTPEQTSKAQRTAEAAASRRNETVRSPLDGGDLRKEIDTNPPAARDERRNKDPRVYISLDANIDNLPRPPPPAALPPLFICAGTDCREPDFPQVYVPYMERGSAYRSKYQDSHTTNKKTLFRGRQSKEEIDDDKDDDPHYIEEDAVFESWLADIWKPGSPGEEREEVVDSKKGWFRGLWGGRKS
ncbi:hypothetical protein E2P81_ATG08843 [Venturia nashicola]|uniref:Uncharacterized protein n=1 Tax=Venturia nashicola TaxID=86259 RepID=A0A4Z1P6B7_9PEZI|nr:hypothetical protein E6O75_ATG09040 [Venturia nashicola]TLD23499.1 hypothetical protein E2P81_ATG08843 [Venturia nashicola]